MLVVPLHETRQRLKVLFLVLSTPVQDCESIKELDRVVILEVVAHRLTIHLTSAGEFVDRTEGVSAAFIRELLWKAALCAADEVGGTEVKVEDQHLEAGLREL